MPAHSFGLLSLGIGIVKLLRSSDWLIVPGVLLLAFFFVAPTVEIALSSIFDEGLTGKHFERFATKGAYVEVFWRTLVRSVWIGILCVLIGYPIAYFIVHRSLRTQVFLMLLILVPLWTSILIRTYAWMVVLGREGIVNNALIWLGLIDKPLRMMFTTGAVYVAMIQILLPIAVIACYSAMTEIDRTLPRAAKVLGASPWKAFRHVFLPLSLEGALTSFVIVFMLSMGFFITPALVGGRKDAMLANVIAHNVEQLNWGFASALALLLLVATIIVIVVVRLLANRFVGVRSVGMAP